MYFHEGYDLNYMIKPGGNGGNGELVKELVSWNNRRMADDVDTTSPEESGRFYEGGFCV